MQIQIRSHPNRQSKQQPRLILLKPLYRSTSPKSEEQVGLYNLEGLEPALGDVEGEFFDYAV